MSVLRGIGGAVVGFFLTPIVAGLVLGALGIVPAPPLIGLLSLIGAAVMGVWAA